MCPGVHCCSRLNQDNVSWGHSRCHAIGPHLVSRLGHLSGIFQCDRTVEGYLATEEIMYNKSHVERKENMGNIICKPLSLNLEVPNADGDFARVFQKRLSFTFFPPFFPK